MSSGHRRSMAMEGCDADKMLDVYIYDLLKKRNFEESAKAFLKESKLPPDSASVAIDVPDGFLLEWWTVFWDVFKVRSGQPHSGIAASYVESQQVKSREQQQQRLSIEGKLRGVPHTGLNSSFALNNVTANPRMGVEMRNPGDSFLRQPPILSRRTLAAKQPTLERETTGSPLISDPLLPIVPVDGIGESSTSNPAPNPSDSNSILLATIPTVGDQQMSIQLGSPGLITQGGDVSQLRHQLHLKGSQGWPLTAGGLRRQMMSTQDSEHLGQFSTQLPQTQRVLSSQMQQQMFSRLQNQAGSQRMSMGSGLNSTALPISVGAGVEFTEGAIGSPSMSQGSHDNREKYLTMSQSPQQQLQQSNVIIPQQHQRQQLAQQDRLIGVGGTSQFGRKRKEKYDSSQYAANSLGAMNTPENFSPSPNSDATLPLTGSSKAQQQLKSQILISMASPSITNETAMTGSEELDDGIAADVDLQVVSNAPPLHEGVSMTTKTVVGDTESADSIPAQVNAAPKFSFREVSCLRASTSKVLCCHFSSNGKLLASAGHDKKVNLWNMTTLKLEQTLEEHLLLITDVRFSPTSTHLATSSFDKTVKVWEIGNPTCSIRTFQGHATSVWALDFHPNNEDLLCSCDGDSEIRYWSVSQGSCIKSFKGGVTQLRFQSRIGRFLAAAAENVVSIFDIESETSVYCLLNHSKPVNNLCWSASGDFLVSLTEDYVRVWSIGSSNVEGGERSKCIYELGCKEKMFQSCVFHPNYPSLLVIGCYQSMELWNMVENKIMTVAAHDGLIVSLVACPITGLVASASHDKCVKLWQ